MGSGAFGAIAAGGGIQADEGDRPDVIQPAAVICERKAQCARHLFFGGRFPQLLFEIAHRVLDLARLVMHQTRHPIQPPQLIEHRPPNAKSGERLERGSAAGAEIAHRLKQSHQTGTVEVIGADVGGERHRYPAYDGSDQGQILFHQRIFDARIASLVIPLPQFLRRRLSSGSRHPDIFLHSTIGSHFFGVEVE